MSSIERDELIRHFGTYSLSRDYDPIIEIPGPDIFGEDVVLFPWAEFTKAARDGNVSLNGASGKLWTFPVTGHGTGPARFFYEKLLKDSGVPECARSGRPIRSRESLHIDHLLLFPVS